MTTTDKDWFKIDRKGLAKLIERRGKVSLVFELISNAFDADGTTRVEVTLTPEEGAPKVWLTVTDDAPDGFSDLSHAYTVFAESSRKAHAEKRGRFNLGEKLVLALCDEASIVTTTGGVIFDARGRHAMRSGKRASGSEFMGLARMTRAELGEILGELRKVIPPAGVALTVNREAIPARTPLATFEATLPTEIADEEGIVRRSERKTIVQVYQPLDGETPMLYELGIPVVDTGDRWHVEIGQKIPLNMDRDNVTPSFLRKVRTLVVNHMHQHLTDADAASTLVNEALADAAATPEAVARALELKYGEKRAIFDPSDREANMTLVSEGYTLIHGSQLTKDQWQNVRTKDSERTKPSGQVKPTLKVLFAPDGKNTWVPRDKWTPAMVAVVAYTKRVSEYLLDAQVAVNVLADIAAPWAACFGPHGFTFNLGRLGHKFFDACFEAREPGGLSPTVALNALIIHECAHHLESNHLDERYHDALCHLGATFVKLALEKPDWFKRSEP